VELKLSPEKILVHRFELVWFGGKIDGRGFILNHIHIIYLLRKMDQLFMALPRDLQWEVLTEFAGTHTVRNGKLLRKLVVGNGHQLIKEMSRIQQIANRNLNGMHTRAYVKLKCFRTIAFAQDSQGVCINYNYFKPYGSHGYYNYGRPQFPGCAAYTPKNLDTLPPYVKNVYPSYPHTNKKKLKNF
jgi:hypothetical protein